MREPYEKKILQELSPKKGNDAQFQITRAKIAEELARDITRSQQPVQHVEAISQVMGATASKIASNDLGEFADINIPKSH